MGSTTLVYVMVALAISLVCLWLGFLWGRSNLKSKIEEALEREHASLDTREFAMRQQLDEAIAEVKRLRPLAEELGRVQDRVRSEQAEYDHLKSNFDAALKGEASAQPEEASGRTQTTEAPQSADEAIQKLLKSLEVTLQEPEEPRTAAPAPAVIEAQPRVIEKKPSPKSQPVMPVKTPSPQREPAVLKASQPNQPAVDEWQEFARSLADLTRRNQS